MILLTICFLPLAAGTSSAGGVCTLLSWSNGLSRRSGGHSVRSSRPGLIIIVMCRVAFPRPARLCNSASASGDAPYRLCSAPWGTLKRCFLLHRITLRPIAAAARTLPVSPVLLTAFTARWCGVGKSANVASLAANIARATYLLLQRWHGMATTFRLR